MKMPEKSGPSIIFMLCDIGPQRVKSMSRISNCNKHFHSLGRNLLISNIPILYGEISKLEIKESGTDVFPLISIIL